MLNRKIKSKDGKKKEEIYIYIYIYKQIKLRFFRGDIRKHKEIEMFIGF